MFKYSQYVTVHVNILGILHTALQSKQLVGPI